MGMDEHSEKLKFFLLGPPMITYHDKILSVPRRQVRILLYLLASQVQPIPYERLHYLFWSDKTESICRRNLSHLFTHIRNILPDKNFLVLNRLSANLQPGMVWSDVIEFKDLCQKIDTEENLPAFVQANHLYQGTFLEGKNIPNNPNLEKVIEQNRVNQEQLYLKNLTKLIMINKNIKKYSEAVEYAEEYLKHDSLNERILSELLILHYLMGNQSKAIQQYETFSEHLAEELNIYPAQRTQEIFNQVKSSFSTTSSQNLVSENSGPPSQIRYQHDHNHLQALQSVMNSKSHPGGVALICGEPGIGKSSLVSAYLNLQNDSTYFRAICTPATKKIRYFPFRALADQIIHLQQKSSIINYFIPQQILDIAAQISKPVQIPQNLSDKAVEMVLQQYFMLIQDLFQEISNLPMRTVVCFENIEWADEESIDLIQFISENHLNKNTSIICTFCCAKEKKIKVFESHIQTSNIHLGTVHIEDLSYEETKKITESWLGRFEEIDQTTERLMRLTSGNPYYVFEILKWIKTTGRNPNKSARNQIIEIPLTITQDIIARLERLSSDEMDILNYAAVRGTPFGFEDLEKALPISTKEILDTLDDLVTRKILISESTTYRIKNEILRRSILNNLSRARRQFLERNLQD